MKNISKDLRSLLEKDYFIGGLYVEPSLKIKKR